jgi:transcription initiation factor TFIIB
MIKAEGYLGKMKALEKMESLFCSECGSRDLFWDQNSGEVVCRKCGLVVEDSIVYTGPEWRAFTVKESEARTRVGLPISFSIYDKGLSTTFNPFGPDGYGKRTSREKKLEMARLKRWQVRSIVENYYSRNLAQAMVELERLSGRLHIPSTVQERAAVTYRKALKGGLVRGRRTLSIVAASLYVACRATHTQRTLAEVASCSPIDKKDISRCYRILLRDMKLRMPIPRAQNRVPKIASKVELGEKTQRWAIEILGEADMLKISAGKDPMGMAAAALYLACVMNGENRTQKMLANASGVTEVTIRNRYTDLKKHLNLDRFKPSKDNGNPL